MPARGAPVGCPDVSLLICGSIATDHLMTFGGKFRDSLVVEQLDKLSVSFLVDELEIRRGGVAPNMCFGLGMLGLSPVLVGAAGDDFADYRSLAGAPQRRLLLGADLRDPAHGAVRVHHRHDDGAVRVVLPRRDERGPADRAQADRGPRRCADVRADLGRRPRRHGAAHPRVPAARLRLHRRPEPAAGLQRRRPDPRPDRRRGLPVLQRVRVAHDRVQDRLVGRRGPRPGRRAGHHARQGRRAHRAARSRRHRGQGRQGRRRRSSRRAWATRSAAGSWPPSSGASATSGPRRSAACSRRTSWRRSAPRSTTSRPASSSKRLELSYGIEAATDIAPHLT